MKKQIATALVVLISIGANGQVNVTRDSVGNFHAMTKARKPSVNKKTEYTYTDAKGKEYPVYEGASGKYYIIRVSSKTGNEYKQYIK